MKSKKEKLAELRGVGKILDILWTNSYYSMGEKASKRIEKEMIYYFGKNWPKDMYDFIQDDKPRCHPSAVETLKQLINKKNGNIQNKN